MYAFGLLLYTWWQSNLVFIYMSHKMHHLNIKRRKSHKEMLLLLFQYFFDRKRNRPFPLRLGKKKVYLLLFGKWLLVFFNSSGYCMNTCSSTKINQQWLDLCIQSTCVIEMSFCVYVHLTWLVVSHNTVCHHFHFIFNLVTCSTSPLEIE